MAKYFSYFPKTFYNLGDKNSVDSITNLTVNFSFDNDITDNSVLYYNYTVKDGETPEIVAYRNYGSAEQHWIILKLNGIMDVKNDWPLDVRSLNRYIDDKYANNGIGFSQTGHAWASSNIHSYYKIETRTFVSTGEKTVDTIRVDANTYANIAATSTVYTLGDGKVLNLSVSKTQKSYYDYEVELNDEKRTIKILKNEFMPVINDEFIAVIRDGR